MSNIDYTKIERPAEPDFSNEDPEGWCEVLAWEEARADKLEKENADLKAVLIHAIAGWDCEEVARHCGVDGETAARVIDLLNK